MRNIQSFSVAAPGVTHTTTISTAVGGTIPTTAGGLKPRLLRFCATATAYVKLLPAAGNAATTDTMVQPGAPVILEVGGNTNYSVIDDGTSCKVNVVPLEDS